MINQPLGRLTAIQYREAAIPVGDGRVGSIDVVRLYFRAPDGSEHEFDLASNHWHTSNTALQFMALYGYQPTELDGTLHDAYDDQVVFPIAPTPEEGGWGLAQVALEGGEEALEDAEWFEPSVGADGSDRPSAPSGAGGPDPGTGNRGGVEEPSDADVTAELADHDSDAGVEVCLE